MGMELMTNGPVDQCGNLDRHCRFIMQFPVRAAFSLIAISALATVPGALSDDHDAYPPLCSRWPGCKTSVEPGTAHAPWQCSQSEGLLCFDAQKRVIRLNYLLDSRGCATAKEVFADPMFGWRNFTMQDARDYSTYCRRSLDLKKFYSERVHNMPVKPRYGSPEWPAINQR